MHRRAGSRAVAVAVAVADDIQVPAMTLDDRLADGQAHAQPVRLGGEEGIEDAGPDFRRNATAGVDDADTNAGLILRIAFLDELGAYDEPAARGFQVAHGVD